MQHRCPDFWADLRRTLRYMGGPGQGPGRPSLRNPEPRPHGPISINMLDNASNLPESDQNWAKT